MRLFYALELAPAETLAIDDWRQRAYAVLGQGVPAENLHITLAFAGECLPAKLEALCEGAAGIDAQCFSLRMDDLGYWPRQGLFWLGCSAPPKALEQLAGSCRRLVAGLQLHKSRKPYLPHITLWRGLQEAPPAPILPPDIELSCESFALYESTSTKRGGVRYSVVERWPLAPVFAAEQKR